MMGRRLRVPWLTALLRLQADSESCKSRGVTGGPPTPAREYFELMGRWVDRLASLSGMDRVTAWSEYTGVLSQVSYSDEAVDAVRAAIAHGDVVEVASRQRHVPVGPVSCFWYELECDARQIRLHFSNHEGAGVLSTRHRTRRLVELRDVLSAAQRAAPQADRVRGGSWLYNLPSYRALFPPSFLARAVLADPRTAISSGSLWGQFLRGDGTLYRPHTEPFIEAIERATTTADLFNAFPLCRHNIVGPVHEIAEWLAPRTTEPWS